jgi:hypothetical protein
MTSDEAIDLVIKVFDTLEGECNIEYDWSKEHNARDMAIKALEQESVLNKIKADIENMRIVYDRSPDYEDDRTDEEKAVDWFNMDKFLFLEIIDKYKAESNG